MPVRRGSMPTAGVTRHGNAVAACRNGMRRLHHYSGIPTTANRIPLNAVATMKPEHVAGCDDLGEVAPEFWLARLAG